MDTGDEFHIERGRADYETAPQTQRKSRLVDSELYTSSGNDSSSALTGLERAKLEP